MRVCRGTKGRRAGVVSFSLLFFLQKPQGVHIGVKAFLHTCRRKAQVIARKTFNHRSVDMHMILIRRQIMNPVVSDELTDKSETDDVRKGRQTRASNSRLVVEVDSAADSWEKSNTRMVISA